MPSFPAIRHSRRVRRTARRGTRRLLARPSELERGHEETAMSKESRTMIAALQLSLDGFIQGPNDEVDWVDSWSDALDLLPDVDAAVVGGGTYPGYEALWGSIADDPRAGRAMLGREAT